MPPSWSTRFLNNGSSAGTPARSNSNEHGATRLNGRDKPLPRPPSDAFDSSPPTLAGRDGERGAMGSPQRSRTHTHGRSVSHPLPKIFGRRKSSGNLAGYHDSDVPLDDNLVPILDEPAQASTPIRVISGKKGKANEEEKVSRKCMCCDCKVNVPRELQKFRCMCCLTINDLKPREEQDSDKEKEASKRADNFPAGSPPLTPPLPLSVERTRAIIDRCILAYLETRCRREDPAIRKPESPAQTPEEEENPINGLPIRQRQNAAPRELNDAPLSSSPPDKPQMGGAIRDFNDFDQFSYNREDTPPIEQPTPHGPGPPSSVPRKPVLNRPTRKPPLPPMPMNVANRTPSQKLHPNGTLLPPPEPSPKPPMSPRPTAHEIEQRRRYDRVKTIFRPLEDYVVASYGDYKCLNGAFSTARPTQVARAKSENNITTPPPEPMNEYTPGPIDLSQLDAKTLLLGDIGENSTWWTGKFGSRNTDDKAFKRKKVGEGSRRAISSKSPNINWVDLGIWYDMVHRAGEDWQRKVDRLKGDAPGFSKERLKGFANEDEIDDDLAEARGHAIRTLLKVTENILKRPTRSLKEPEELRFLLIILANPSLYPSPSKNRKSVVETSRDPRRTLSEKQNPHAPMSPKKSPNKESSSQHTGLLKRIFGLLAGSNENCHRYLIGWFAHFDEKHFVKIVDLVASFVTHRISRRSNRSRSKSFIADGGLIPDLSGSALNTSAQLHSALGLSGSGSMKKRPEDQDQEPDWASDWQIKAAAKFMALLFAANNIWQGRRSKDTVHADLMSNEAPQVKAKRSNQLLHTSTFYNTLLDYQDMIADFKVWEAKRDNKFAFCQYPLFLSMGTKIKILEYDARRQMEIKAREAYFDSVIRQRALDGYFHLRVRRDCLVGDSLQQIREAVGSGQEEVKKGLRVHFTGEEGVDAGGLRKEWFLMLVRDIFDPNHGLFVYDDESNMCYFNPNSFENSDQYNLVGALLGLAIYNSTILDIAFPPFAFRKLLAAAPGSAPTNVSSLTGTKGQMTYTLADLAEFRPSLAVGLQQLLDFDGDVQETYCRDFVATVERYGTTVEVPLRPNGEGTPVTNENRHEFVDAYVRYLLDTAVVKQFEPFKRGFFTVCAGNALSLFRAEEIELLVRGSDEALDVDSLKAVAVYENWRHFQPPHQTVPDPAESVPVIQWFWDLFAQASPDRQRKLLTFITGTDRIPAVGATSLVLRIVAAGDGWGGGGAEERERFPVARTCFNMIVLHRYDFREALETKLWRAVEESEGFGLK